MSRSPGGATVARYPKKDCGAGATRARLRGVDVRHGLIYVRRAGVRGDRRFPVRAAPGEWLLRIERGRRPHRGCRGVERGWRKNEERDGQRGPCEIDPDGVRLPVAGRVRFLFHASRTFGGEYRTVSRMRPTKSIGVHECGVNPTKRTFVSEGIRCNPPRTGHGRYASNLGRRSRVTRCG